MIAVALIAGLQVRPQSLLPSAGTLQVSITGDPLTSDPLNVTCHGSHGSLVQSFTSLNVTISSVEAHRTGALNLTGDWIPIPGAPKTLDLLDLKSFTQLLGSVSSGHLDAQTSAQVTSGKVTSITLEVIQPHVVCEGNSTFRLTPELTAISQTTD